MRSASTRPAVADRLHSVAIHLLRTLRRQDDASGTSAARLSVLSVVVFGGPCSAGELARLEQVRPPTMTRLLDGLERDGLVSRTVSSEDARSRIVAATPAGRALLHRARRRRLRALEAILAELPADDVSVIGRAVAALERALSGAPCDQRSRATGRTRR